MSKAPLIHSKVRSNTGHGGVSESVKRGRTCFVVSWRPAVGAKKTTTVYFGFRGVTRESALERARQIRFDAIAERMKSERRIVP